MARLTKAQTEFVARARVVRVGSADRRGVPHVVPVCAVLADGRLYFASSSDARKVQNVRANPRISVVVDDYTEAWDGLRGVMLSGEATIHARGPKFRKARERLYEKFPQYPSQAALGVGDSVVVEVRPTRVFAWGFD
jgi:nitroimidazol reductase NimA-like FMN-containing flavoprotein (pyridoxamine 5'-phosphate oxidase superfamily)